ncbi:hypothetical protein M569_14943 [Genlisea aurea]|uniref:Uncharacterized protein n=1 Tax=Genlisea aurea TaxID=192259 RepID=S8DK81_9LAMI|nr:hypothetical protein M569_14943 [Genlisea aurea]
MAGTTPTSPTFEQLLKDEQQVQHYSPPPANDAFFGMRTNPPEEDEEELFDACSTPGKRSSVLAKVKERAKKLKSSLSIKRKQADHPNNDAADAAAAAAAAGAPPSSGAVDLDGEEPDEDPEYLGAPIYESEAAPESLREHARQHPRAVPVVSESRRVPSNIKKTEEEEAHIETDPEEEKKEPNRTDSEKLTIPAAYAAAVSDDATAETLASKIASLTTVSTTAKTEDEQRGGPIEDETETDETPSAEPNRSRTASSVKEFLMNKLEPGDDERALSQAITAAITPNSAAVKKKMRGALTSLFSDASNGDDARQKGPSLDSAKSRSAKYYQPPPANPALSRSLTAAAHQG